MTRTERQWSDHALLWALLGSVLLHLLLLLVSILAPSVLGLVAMLSPVPPAPEQRIQFTFAPPGERELTGQAPVLPQPAPTPVAPRGELVPVPRTTPPTPPAERMAQATERAAPAAEAPGAVFELPDSERADPLRERETSRPPERPDEPPPERRRELDIGRALQEFDQALARARDNAPPGPANPGGTPQHVFVPDFSALPTTGYGVGNLEFESRDYDWSDYGRQIYIAIWRAWHNRLYLTTDEFERWAYRNQSWMLEHANRINFTIQRNGEVTAISVVTPSGCAPLDLSATDALEEVVLPPLPADFPRDRETVRAAFIAQGDIQGMRRFLSWAKRRGLF